MGHYDDAYEAEAKEHAKSASKRAREQLKLMEKFLVELHQGPGYDGISKRHQEHFQDMLNETRLRAR